MARVMMARALPAPRVTVAVTLGSKPLRLRWLLNALEEQTLSEQEWEAVVAYGRCDPADLRRLAIHPLVAAGRVTLVACADAGAGEVILRNLAWRRGRGEIIAFTCETCRPEPEWLSALAAVAGSAPWAIVQGPTRPDPDELPLADGPRVATCANPADSLWGEHTSIAYPRTLLERLEGLDEALAGRAAQTDLLARARAAGARLVSAPGAVVNHAVEVRPLPAALREAWSLRSLPALARRHPEVRSIGWAPGVLRASHAGALLAGAALGGAAVMHPLAGLGALPWIAGAAWPRRAGASGLAEAALRTPGNLVVDAAEVAAMLVGSARTGVLFL